MAEIYTSPSGRQYEITGRNPGMYPTAPGPNYVGELKGWVYNPWYDKYQPSQSAADELAYETGEATRPKNPSLMRQIAPYGAGLLAAEGAKQIGEKVVKPYIEKGADAFNGLISGDAPTQTTTTPSEPAASASPAQSANTGLLATSAPNVTPIQTNADGTTLAIDNTTGAEVTLDANGQIIQNAQTTAPAESGLLEGKMNYGQIATGGLQAYEGYQQYKEGNKVGGGLNMASGAANVYAGTTGSATAGKYGSYLQTAAGSYAAYKAGTNRDNPSDKVRVQQATKQTVLTVAGAMSLGIVPLIYNLGMRTGAGRKIDRKIDAFDRKLGNWSPVTNKLMTGTLKMLGFGKSTEGYQSERWGNLYKQNEDFGSAWAAAHPEGDTGIWTSGKYAGEAWTFDKAKDLVLNPESNADKIAFIGNLGNFETFGDKWAVVPVEKQIEITRRLTAEGLYTPDKGDILISGNMKTNDGIIHQDRAKQIFEEEVGVSFEEAPSMSDLSEEEQQKVVEDSAAILS